MFGRRHVAALAVAALVVASTGVVAVRVGDTASTDGARDLDLSAPPREVAVRALEQTERGDYTMMVWTGETGVVRDETTFERRYRVSNTRGRIRANFTTFRGHSLFFGNERCGWGRPPDRDQWRRVCPRPLWPREVQRLFYEQAMKNVSVTVLATDASRLVLAVNDTEAAAGVLGLPRDVPNRTANLTLVIDRETERLRRVVFRQSWPGHREKAVYGFSGWGETSVERPEEVSYTLVEFLADAAVDGAKRTG